MTTDQIGMHRATIGAIGVLYAVGAVAAWVVCVFIAARGFSAGPVLLAALLMTPAAAALLSAYRALGTLGHPAT